MFYFDKHDSRVLFQDIRDVETTLCDGRHFEVKPDIQADFTNMPYPDGSFSMVVSATRLCRPAIRKSNTGRCIPIGEIC